jgi:hypothetical protein
MPGADTSTAVYVPAICLGVSFESCLMRAVPFEGELPMFFSSCLKSSLLAHPLSEFDANNRDWFQPANSSRLPIRMVAGDSKLIEWTDLLVAEAASEPASSQCNLSSLPRADDYP